MGKGQDRIAQIRTQQERTGQYWRLDSSSEDESRTGRSAIYWTDYCYSGLQHRNTVVLNIEREEKNELPAMMLTSENSEHIFLKFRIKID